MQNVNREALFGSRKVTTYEINNDAYESTNYMVNYCRWRKV